MIVRIEIEKCVGVFEYIIYPPKGFAGMLALEEPGASCYMHDMTLNLVRIYKKERSHV